MEIAAHHNFLFDMRCGAKVFFDRLGAAINVPRFCLFCGLTVYDPLAKIKKKGARGMKKLGTFLGIYVICFLVIFLFVDIISALGVSDSMLAAFLVPVPLALLVWALYGLICRIEKLEKRIDELTGKPEGNPKE